METLYPFTCNGCDPCCLYKALYMRKNLTSICIYCLKYLYYRIKLNSNMNHKMQYVGLQVK